MWRPRRGMRWLFFETGESILAVSGDLNMGGDRPAVVPGWTRGLIWTLRSSPRFLSLARPLSIGFMPESARQLPR